MSSDINERIKRHSHDVEGLKKELIDILENAEIRVEFLSAAATPLASIATSSSILTFLSLQFFFNSSQKFTQILTGINILILLSLVFISLIIQVMIHRARLRIARIKLDLELTNILENEGLTGKLKDQLIKLSHFALKSQGTIDRVQWLYNHGLFRLLYVLISLTVVILMYITINEIGLLL
jgi:hypothetical protein